MRVLFSCVSFALLVPAALAADAKSTSVTDPAKAGPDFAIQGEYLGMAGDKAKLGAEVVAVGNDQYMVNFLPGGLRGEGGDYAKRIQASGKTGSGKTTITSKVADWTATIASNQMTGKTGSGQAFTLKRVVRKSKSLGEKPPANALVLFDGHSADQWKNGKVVDGNLLGSDIDSKKDFQDFKAHVEFRLSYMPTARGQGRSNSGVYLQHRYEIQVLDSFGLKGANNECGGIYSQVAPTVNMCYPPLQWQTYDIEFHPAKFDTAGKKTGDAVVSIWHNGVQIHDKVHIKGPTGGGRPETPAPGPLFLQGHGGQVQYRNIWVVDLAKSK